MIAAPQHRPRPLPLFLDLLRRETAGDPTRLARALAGLRRYQEAPRRPPEPPRPPVAERAGVVLRDYGGDGPAVVVVPSLINPPTVLDLSPGASLLAWLASQGWRVLLVDWGEPCPERRRLTLTGHVEEILLPLLDGLPQPPLVAGYCLGGTMALAVAASRPVRALALIAAPWHFAAYGRERAQLARLWDSAAPLSQPLGLLPMEVLQSAFWSLDPARTVAKFERFADLEAERAEAFVALEDWANDGPPLPFPAAQELFQSFIGADASGRGRWFVSGRAVDPSRLEVPVLNILSSVDRITPAASAAGVGQRLHVDLGHVGMIVGRGARAGLWEPLRDWMKDVAPR